MTASPLPTRTGDPLPAPTPPAPAGGSAPVPTLPAPSGTRAPIADPRPAEPALAEPTLAGRSVADTAAPADATVPAATTATLPERAGTAAAPSLPPATRRQAPAVARRARNDDRGQATAEYGLVILVAGLIALGVIAWVRDSSVFTDLFSGIIDTLTSSV